MSFQYRVLVSDASGTLRDTYTSADAFLSFDSFDITPGGNCGDATFTALPSAVDIRPRDIVTLQHFTTGWVSVYTGVVVQAGNVRSDDVQEYRCAGLRQRLYETTVLASIIKDGESRFAREDISDPLEKVFQGDVAKMVWEALDDLTLPGGVTFAETNAPELGFELGVRYPNLESVGELLDALAETVGEFIVPAGEPYEYDGVTFTEGQTLPAVAWGVNADGELFFRRPLTAAVVVSESTPGVQVEWDATVAEDVINGVRLVYANAYDLGLFERALVFNPETRFRSELQPEPLPIARTFVSDASVPDGERSWLVHVLEDPFPLMVRDDEITAWSFGHWTNDLNVIDGDPDTWADSTATGWSHSLYVGYNFGEDTGAGREGILRVRYKSPNGPLPFVLTISPFFQNTITLFGELPEVTDEPATVALVAATPRIYEEVYDPSANARFLDIFGRAGAQVFNVDWFRPDVDAGGTRSALFAQTLERAARTNASTVTVQGFKAAADTLSLQPVAGGSVLAAVARTSYVITTDAGAQTVYHVDQGFDASEETQRVLLERLARRAVRVGGRSR